ncbi:histidine kinase [Brasilonema sp. UFV-L1]|nr:histidine kinase [Brasilonema sp. UFV-L1]
MISTHWREVHTPDERELRLLDILTRQAADFFERRRAQNVLRQSEEKYRSLFNSIDEGFCLFEMIYDETPKTVDYRFLEVNSVFERQTGLKNVVGKLGSKIAPNTESYWLKTYDEVVKTGKPQRIENYSQSTDRWYSAYASRVGGMGSRQVCTVFSDITDRKRYEQRQAFLLQLSDALRSLSDAVEIHAAVTRIAMNFFGADRCYYCEIVDGNAIIRQDASREGLPSVAGVYPLSSFPILKTAIDAGHPFVVDDAHTTDLLDEALRQLCCELQVISFLNVPVIKAGEPTGVLCITQTTPRNWTAFETELAQETAERIWAAVERARAETSLRESEAKYRSLFTSMDEGFCLIEVLFDERGTAFDYRFLEANPAFEKQTGLVNAIGKTVRELVPQHEAQWFEIYGRIALTGVPERFENAAQELGRFYDVYAFRLGEAQERKVAVIFNDISERKRAEETQAFVLKLTDSLRPLSDPVAIQETAMQVLGTHLGVNRAFYGEVLDDDDTLAIGPGYADELSPIVGQIKFSDFDSDLLTDYRAGRTVVINDLYVDMQLSAKAKTEFDAIQVRAAVGVALLKNEKVRAILSIHQSVLRKWTEAEIALLKETADRTWAAVERARAEAALRESEIERVREQSAHEQERQRAETLVELDRAKTLFFNNVSHEFRTPLTLSLAPLQDALSDCVNPLAPPHRERLELAHRNAIRLLKLVNTLLDFSRIEAGRMEAVYEATNLALLTTELASVFHSAIERAGLQFIVDCPPLPEPVYVDREMWEKIVLNLLSNAFKFTFAGEIAVRLHPADDHHVRLQVQDTGTGIPTEELPHLFERFYQIRGAKARTHEGSGIGLALVHELIRLHGGTIDVSSTVGQGSCFTVTIPLGRAHLPNDRLRRVVGDSPTETLRERITATRTQASTAIGADPYVEEAERWLPQEEGGREGGKEGRKDIFPHSHTPTLPHSPSARVLVVDDNADMRDYLTRILSEHVEVEAVADGAAALAAAQERVPDLVLSDVMMPQMDGFELLKALRAEACTREIPIILLSARAGEESVIEGLQALADDYLIKPFSATELVTRVLAHLQMAQLRGEALRQERTTSRRKDEMLSTVSHELNTPLVAILGWTRLLRTSPLNQSMLWKSLETIERNATLQAKLISDLLDISRITAGKLHLNLEPVELQSVIEMAIATVNQSAQTKDIRLECILNPLPTTVQGDPERLQQIVLNLLTNAIKFTSKGGRIEVRLNASETHAQIVVSDTGCGISAEFLPYVFDSFRQAESSKSQSIKGLGLGLAIARHLVELHGGTIYVESPGIEQGATFTVNLPLIGVNF